MPNPQTPAVINVFNDFYNENSHRCYPFESINSVPTQLIIGMGIISNVELPDNSSDDDSVYISKLVTDGIQLRVYLSMDKGGTTTDFGCIATINAGSLPGDRINFQSAEIDPPGDVIFEGFIVIGDMSVLQKMPPITYLTAEEGRLHTTCIQHMTRWVAGLRVGTRLLGGVVTLTAGPGIEFEVVDNTVRITCSGAIPPANSIIQSDLDLLNELIDLYGAPITSINSVMIDHGDWAIRTVESEGLTATADGDTHSITINNTTASACCTQDSISVLVDNIAELNERVGLLQSFQEQMEANLNTLSVQISHQL